MVGWSNEGIEWYYNETKLVRMSRNDIGASVFDDEMRMLLISNMSERLKKDINKGNVKRITTVNDEVAQAMMDKINTMD
jgi:uncharacterized protein YeeX (DUF496 family)